MSFFDQVPPLPERHEPRRDHVTPPWFGPPDGVLPTPLLARAVVVRTDKVLLTMDHFSVFPAGVQFTINLSVRPPASIHDMPWELHGRNASADDPEFLRLGIAFSDGSTWTNLPGPFPSFDEEPTGPVVISQGGGGGENSWSMDQWLWPIPPPGDLTIYAAWPAYGVDETSIVIDATPFAAAAKAAEQIWLETPQ